MESLNAQNPFFRIIRLDGIWRWIVRFYGKNKREPPRSWSRVRLVFFVNDGIGGIELTMAGSLTGYNIDNKLFIRPNIIFFLIPAWLGIFGIFRLNTRERIDIAAIIRLVFFAGTGDF